MTELRLTEVLTAMSAALDITEGEPPGHSARTAAIAVRLGEAVGLARLDQSELLHASLLKDAGCSATAARVAWLFDDDDRAVKAERRRIDHTRTRESLALGVRHAEGPRQILHFVRRGRGTANEIVATRCERGAEVARLIGLGSSVGDAIAALDELWDGRGRPLGLRGKKIPVLARIMGLAQTVELFLDDGPAAALAVAQRRSGTWFDPSLVDLLTVVQRREGILGECSATRLDDMLADAWNADEILPADEERLDRVAEAFAAIIDAKSPYTGAHSTGVARIGDGIARRLGWRAEDLRRLRRAALLHDVGKLGVPNTILDKPGRLTDEEMDVMRGHAALTGEILGRVSAFSAFASDAAAHHERLDGGGYPLGLKGDELSATARVLAVADVTEALSADRPYRTGMAPAQVAAILSRQAGGGLCPVAVGACLEDLLGPRAALAA